MEMICIMKTHTEKKIAEKVSRARDKLSAVFTLLSVFWRCYFASFMKL